MTSRATSRISRRGILAGSGIAAAAALGGGYIATTNVANAAEGVPSSGKFDLTASSDRLFWKKPLNDPTVLQCFSFDNTNQRLYTLQVAGESGSGKAGHLTLTQLDLNGERLGRMNLRGFGHGIAFGVQPTNDGPVLWTEADADTSGESARATKVCRFSFDDGATISKDDVELIEPIEGMYSASCALDLDHGTIAVRYTTEDADDMRVSLYDFEAFAAGTYEPLADVSCSTVHPPGEVTPQGWQQYGQHLYMFQGNAYHHDEGEAEDHCDVEHPDGELDGNAKVSRINFNDESDHETDLTKAGYSLSFREPEGLGLLITEDGPRLCMGFASGCSGDRRASVYYKSEFA